MKVRAQRLLSWLVTATEELHNAGFGQAVRKT